MKYCSIRPRNTTPYTHYRERLLLRFRRTLQFNRTFVSFSVVKERQWYCPSAPRTHSQRVDYTKENVKRNTKNPFTAMLQLFHKAAKKRRATL